MFVSFKIFVMYSVLSQISYNSIFLTYRFDCADIDYIFCKFGANLKTYPPQIVSLLNLLPNWNVQQLAISHIFFRVFQLLLILEFLFITKSIRIAGKKFWINLTFWRLAFQTNIQWIYWWCHLRCQTHGTISVVTIVYLHLCLIEMAFIGTHWANPFNSNKVISKQTRPIHPN